MHWAPYDLIEEQATLVEDYFLLESEITTSVDSPSSKVEWTVYPNPANSILHIEMDHPNYQEAELFDGLGRRMLQTPNYQLDVSTLPSGTYWLKVRVAEEVSIRGVIIER